MLLQIKTGKGLGFRILVKDRRKQDTEIKATGKREYWGDERLKKGLVCVNKIFYINTWSSSSSDSLSNVRLKG